MEGKRNSNNMAVKHEPGVGDDDGALRDEVPGMDVVFLQSVCYTYIWFN